MKPQESAFLNPNVMISCLSASLTWMWTRHMITGNGQNDIVKCVIVSTKTKEYTNMSKLVHARIIVFCHFIFVSISKNMISIQFNSKNMMHNRHLSTCKTLVSIPQCDFGLDESVRVQSNGTLVIFRSRHKHSFNVKVFVWTFVNKTFQCFVDHIKIRS